MKWRQLFNIFLYIFAAIGFVLVVAYAAVELGLTKDKSIIDTQHDYFQKEIDEHSWSKNEEWLVLEDAIKKDVGAINVVSSKTGVPARIIITPLVVEQLRLFYSDRELFKTVFAPLKILGNQSQFSWGVMGIKQETARRIESNLKDRESPWYLGKEFENILDYASTTKSSEIDAERFTRLTNENDRYYSYLYGAIYIKQLEQQWKKAGFPITDKPDIIATLYNIGFDNSKPHSNPLSGGSEIELSEIKYSFGSLAQSFYDSDELINEFGK